MPRSVVYVLPLAVLLANQASAQPRPPLAVVDTNVVDVIQGAVLSHQSLVIADGRITDIGAADTVKIPSQAMRIPGQGRYLIPGLWDMHVHLRSSRSKPEVALVEANAALLDLFLPNGVVGVREMGGDLADYVLQWREEIRTGKRTGPRILTAVRKIDQEPPDWPGSLGVKTPAEAREAVRQMKQAGADFIKVYFSRIPPEVLAAVVDEAHKLNLRVTGHWPGNIPIQAVTDIGQDGIEHVNYLPVYRRPEYEQFANELAARRGTEWAADGAEVLARRLYLLDDKGAEQVYRAMAAKSVWITPTLTVMTRIYQELGTRDFSQDPRQAFVFPAVWESWDPKLGGRKPVEGRPHALMGLFLKRCQAALLAVYKAGVPMLAGTDCGVNNSYMFPGWSLHDELESLVAAGVTPADALRMATINAARWRGEADSQGSIEKGKVADLVLLRSDPLEAIRHTREIEAVVDAGKYYSRTDLDTMLQEAARRAAAARHQSSALLK